MPRITTTKSIHGDDDNDYSRDVLRWRLLQAFDSFFSVSSMFKLFQAARRSMSGAVPPFN
jgi:hypothetical protein